MKSLANVMNTVNTVTAVISEAVVAAVEPAH